MNNGEKIYAPNGNVWIHRENIYGRCMSNFPSRFMENLPSNHCVIDQADVMTEELCTKLSAKTIVEMTIYAGNESKENKGSEIKVTPGTQKKFDMDSFTEMSWGATAPTTFQDTVWDAASNSCDNFVLETHYKVFFTETDPN